MGKILIDSSVIISGFREREVTYQEAKNFLASGQPIIVLDYILAEIATVLKIRENRTAMKKCIDYLEPVYNLRNKRAKKANTTIWQLVLSLRSQFRQRRRHLSNHPKERSTTHRLGITSKV